MTVEHADFARFSRELDTEWFRQRLRSGMGLPPTIDEEELSRALGQADPLAEMPSRGWFEKIGDALGTWPRRIAVAAMASALVVLGVVIDRSLPISGPSVQSVELRVDTKQPPLPRFAVEPGVRLGISAPVKPESERRFQEAMSFYGAPDFGRRALPLLRAAVGADPGNDQAQFWLGVVLLLNGDTTDAIRVLEEAVRLGPGSTLYKKYLVYAYLRVGASEKALAVQTELLRQP